MDLRIGFYLFFCFVLFCLVLFWRGIERGANSLPEDLGDILLPLCPDPWTKLLNTRDHGDQMAGCYGVECESSHCKGVVLFFLLMVFLKFLAFSVFRLCCEHGTLVCLFGCRLFWEETQGNNCPEGPTIHFANLRANGLCHPSFPLLQHPGILWATFGWM